MKQKLRKKLVEKEIIHQHLDKNGQICGQSHPLKSIHKKDSTMKAHYREIIKNTKKEG